MRTQSLGVYLGPVQQSFRFLPIQSFGSTIPLRDASVKLIGMGQVLGIHQRPPQPSLYLVYLAWVDAWLSLSGAPDKGALEAPLSLEALAGSLRPSNLSQLLKEANLRRIIQSLKSHCANGNLTLGGPKAASCEETDLLSEQYNPQTACDCNGNIPCSQVKDPMVSENLTKCRAVERTLRAMKGIQARQNEWNCEDIFTAQGLEDAVTELVLSNMETHRELDTCRGPGTVRDPPTVQAPDRRPHPLNDTSPDISRQLYPTSESQSSYAQMQSTSLPWLQARVAATMVLPVRLQIRGMIS